jgi:hypothetical protein
MSTKSLERLLYCLMVVTMLIGICGLVQSCKEEDPQNVVMYTKEGKPITVSVVPARRATAPPERKVGTNFMECNDSNLSVTYRCIEYVNIYDSGYVIVYTNNGVSIVQSRGSQ